MGASSSSTQRANTSPPLSASESGEAETPQSSTINYVKPRNVKHAKEANRIIDNLGDLPSDQITPKQAASLKWARNVLELQPPKKRKSRRSKSLSRIDTAQLTHLKNACEVNKGCQLLAIIDQNHVDGTISLEDWKLVEIHLLKIFLDIVKEHPGPPPQCRDMGWYQGRVKLIACTDERSAQLLQLAVSRIESIYPNSGYAAVTMAQVPNRPRAKVWIPAEPSDAEQIIKIIKTSNPQIPTANWQVLKLGEVKGKSRCVTLVINEEALEKIINQEGVISYGFGAVDLKILAKNEIETLIASERLSNEAEEMPTTVNEKASGPLKGDTSTMSFKSATELVGGLFNEWNFSAAPQKRNPKTVHY